MAAILKLRRGTSIPSLAESELFYHTSLDTLVVGDGSNSHILLKSGSNTVNTVDISGTISSSYIHISNDLNVDGNATIGGNITFGGSLITLGDADTDNIVITGELSSSLIPNDDNSFDLGSSSKRYKNLYVVSASIEDVTLDGSGILSSSTQISNYGIFAELNSDSLISSSQQISDYNRFLEINGDNVFSSSIQVNADSITNFDTNVKDKMNSDGVLSGSSQLTTEFDLRYLNTNGDSVISSSAQLTTEFDTRYLNTNGDSVISSSAQLTTEFDTRYLNTNGDSVFSSSIQVNADDITNFDSNVKDKLNVESVLSSSAQLTNEFDTRYLNTNGDSVFSSSIQVNADDITNFDSNVKDKMNSDSVISGSTQITDGSGILSSSNENFANYSQSVDSRLDTLEGTFSQSVDSRLDELEGNFSSSVDSQLNGLYTYTSSLKNSIDVSGQNLTVYGNLTVQGTQTSLNTNDLIVEDKLIAVASGSTTSAQADGAGLFISGANKSITWDDTNSTILVDSKVSSSVGFKGNGSELTNIQNTNIDFGGSGIVSGSSQVSFDGISDKPTLFSSSIQVDADDITNFDTNVKDKINADGVLSSSAQLTPEFDLRYLNAEGDGVFSSSIQVNADDITNFDSNVLSYINSQNVHSSSYLGTATTSNLPEGTNKYYTDTRVFNYVNDLGVLSGSDQVTSSLDLKYLQINGDSVVSSSEQILIHLRGTNIVSSSTQVSVVTDGTGIVSGSSQITFSEIGGLPDGIISSSVLSSTTQGVVTLLNNGTGQSADLGLETSDSPQFTGITLTGLPNVDSNEYTSLFLSSSNEIGIRNLATAAFYHVSSSIDDGNPNVLGSAGAIKSYVDGKIIEAGSGDITEVTPTPGGGLAGGGYVGAVSLSLDTGSTHFTDGVVGVLPNGLLSSSAQVISSLPSGVISGSSQLPSGLVSESAQTLIHLNGTGIISSSEQIDSDLFNIDGLISSSEQLDGTTIGATSPSIFSGSFSGSFVGDGSQLSGVTSYTDSDTLAYINSRGVISGSSQLTSSYDSRYLNTNGDGVVSGSSQLTSSFDTRYLNTNSDGILSSSVQDFDTFSGSVDTRIDSLEGSTHTHSNKSNLDTINQDLATDDNVEFNKVTLATASVDLIEINGTAGQSGSLVVGGTYVQLNAESGFGIALTPNASSADALTIDTAGNTTIRGAVAIETISNAASSTNALVVGAGNVVSYRALGTNAFTSDLSDYNTGDLTEGTNKYYTDSRVKTKLNAETVVSSSAQVVSSLLNQDIDLGTGGISGSSLDITGNAKIDGNLVLGGNLTIGDATSDTIAFSGEVSSHIIPSSNNQYDLGSNAKRWRSIYVGANTIDLGGTLLQRDGVTGNIQFIDSGSLSAVSAVVDFDTLTNKPTLVSSSNQLTSSLVDLSSTQTISGTKTFNDIVVNGTGSFAYITSVSGTAKIIGDNYIILNNDTPTQRYAGIAVYDSGSAGVTASLEFDGQTNDWFYEYSDDGGVTTDHGVVLFGPEYSGKGSPTYLTNNRIPKSEGTHHLEDSNITDNGTTITLGSAVDVSGVTNFNNTTNSTSKTTGAVIIDGGVGIAKTLNVGEDIVAYASSDRELKDNIQPISNPLDKINQISGNSFTWNEEKQNIYKGKDYGVIAQEIEEILPELVQTRENGYKAVKYDKIVSLLIEGIKELSKEVTDLKNRLG